jgi:serine protease Do
MAEPRPATGAARRDAVRRPRAAPLCAALLLLLACAAGARPPHEKLEARIVEIAEQITPSVVHIEAIVKFNDRRNQVTGSGVIVSSDGRILTNEHVVDRAEKVTVTVPGLKKKYPARVVGADRQTDIALLRITPDVSLPAVRFGAAQEVRVGQWVLAIGNPYGLEGTVSFGIVSAKGRNLEIPDLLNDFIQTDAMIDRGSSGGPLVDLDGRVVGINSRGQGRGIGFGITIQPLDRELADYFEIPDTTGVVVNSVVTGSPAEAAGIAPGDVITAFNGVAVEAEKEEDLGSFQRLVAAVEPGDEARMQILRKGEPLTARAVIGTQPKIDPAEVESELGFHVQEITANLERDHRLDSKDGAFVFFVARGSPAREAGLRVGDIIVGIEDTPIVDLDDFEAAIASAENSRRFLIRARRGDEIKFLLVKPGARAAEDDEATDAGEVAHPRPPGS